MLIEWPEAEREPTKCWLSNLPVSISLRKLVAIAKLRWRIERDYEELKQELGLGHFEGRKLARLSSPRDPVDRRLWLPGIGAMPFPPSGHSTPLRANDIRFPYPACNAATLPEALPVRTERHNPRSIAPLRRKIDPFRSISASLSLLSSRLLIRQ